MMIFLKLIKQKWNKQIIQIKINVNEDNENIQIYNGNKNINKKLFINEKEIEI